MDEEGPEASEAVAEGEAWANLVQRLRSGDCAAEAEVCARFYPRILTMAAARLRSAEAARDVAQEVIAAILPALRNGQLRDPHKLPAFIYGTSRNLINNLRRSAALSPDVVSLPDTLSSLKKGVDAEHQQDQERRHAVRLVLTMLKPMDRKILLLTLLQGMHPREIAPLVGLSAEAVRTRKTRAIRAVLARVRKMSRTRRDSHT